MSRVNNGRNGSNGCHVAIVDKNGKNVVWFKILQVFSIVEY
jgi:hypothetical protein